MKTKLEAENISNLYFFRNKSIILQKEVDDQRRLYADLNSKYLSEIKQIQNECQVRLVAMDLTMHENQDDFNRLRDEAEELSKLKASNSYKVFSRYRMWPNWIRVLIRSPILLLVRVKRVINTFT